jgi:predicted transcriptional regulator
MSEPDLPTFHTDREGIRKVLGDLETEILELAWERAGDAGVTARDIYEELRLRRSIAYTTVMTTMQRLHRKGLLACDRRDQAYVYSPNMSREQFIERFVGRILDDLLVSFSGAALSHLASEAEPEERDRVEELLARIVERRKRGEA